MGTRADFYVGRGTNAEWLGSVAWDGYPDGFDRDGLLNAINEQQFRDAVAAELANRKDGTSPEMGWPWPWEDSHTTDYAYAFDGDKVFGTCGDHWFDAHAVSVGDGNDEQPVDDTAVNFPDMSARMNIDFGRRSGVIVIGS